MIFSPSRIDRLSLDGFDLLVKRDDKLSREFSGNKIRKLYALFERSDLNHIVSYGGYQSNAMLSIAYFAQLKGIPFTYISKPVPEWVHKMTEGNYFHATRAGMKNIEVFHIEYSEYIATLHERFPDALIIDQGAATPLAEAGIKQLAEEITDYAKETGIEKLTLLLPSGTGSTSLYLAKHLPATFRVVTTPCAGDETYLRKQWQRLEPKLARYPEVIHTAKKHHFAKPYPDLMAMWEKLYSAGIEFDMVYAPKTWLAFFENRKSFEGEKVMYIHTGGVLGNATQRLRYERKKIC